MHDLEDKLKAYDENSLSSSESILDLKRELARFKESETYSTKYIADLEMRLTKSDESVLALQQSVEQLEEECERRRNEVNTLQSKLDAIQKDGDGWRTDLEEREKRVLELEQKMAEWEEKKKEAGDARSRLGNVVEEVVSAKKNLESLSNNSASPNLSSNDLTTSSISHSQTVAEAITQTDEDAAAQYLALQQTHTATLADLSNVTSKYRDALREISDLAAQLEETKLGSTTITEDAPFDSPAAERPDFPQFRRRMPSGKHRDEPHSNATGRRLFFRQAASAESLHSRYVLQILS